MRRFQAGIAMSAATLLLAASSVQAHHEEFGVITDVISHEDTQEIYVWAPMADEDDDRPFPVVYAIAGSGGYGSDWDVIGSALAARGVVVFATDYHQEDMGIGRFDRIIKDVECGYRYVREVAAAYGGDLEQPVAGLGHSLGAELALGGALDDVSLVPGGTYDECFAGVERADSFDTTYIEIPGTSHIELIGHDIIDGEFVTLPDEEAVLTVTYAVLEAISSFPGAQRRGS